MIEDIVWQLVKQHGESRDSARARLTPRVVVETEVTANKLTLTLSSAFQRAAGSRKPSQRRTADDLTSRNDVWRSDARCSVSLVIILEMCLVQYFIVFFQAGTVSLHISHRRRKNVQRDVVQLI